MGDTVFTDDVNGVDDDDDDVVGNTMFVVNAVKLVDGVVNGIIEFVYITGCNVVCLFAIFQFKI